VVKDIVWLRPWAALCTITAMNNRITLPVAAFMFLSCTVFAVDWDTYNREDYEEPAGASFALLANPKDNIYGVTFGDGTWLKNTPVFGDYFLGTTYNGVEEAWYGSIGMTIRLMPHWRVAPFIGAGGSYNYSLSGLSSNTTTTTAKEYSDQGDSYAGGHAEAGIRVLSENRAMLFEIMGRYTWTSLKEDRNYWLVGISIGIGLGSSD